MFTILSAIIGALTGILPNAIKVLELKTQKSYELEVIKLQIQAAKDNIELTSLVDEGKSLRDSDNGIHATGFMETLRASIRPLITYFFFIMFCAVKITAAWFMFSKGYDGIAILNAVWDVYTMAIFGSIMGFWFGSRAIAKMGDTLIQNQKAYNVQPIPTAPTNMSPPAQNKKSKSETNLQIS